MKPLPDKLTIGQKYDPAMKITDPQEAEEYMQACVEHSMRINKITLEKAIVTERSNLGYYAGYCDEETRERVEKLFGAVHPVMGSVKNKWSAEDAFNLGKKVSQNMSEGMPMEDAVYLARAEIKPKLE